MPGCCAKRACWGSGDETSTTGTATGKALRAVRNAFGPEAEHRKRTLLAALAAAPPRTAKALRQFHDDLLFLCAFPGEPATLYAAHAALDSFESAVDRLRRADARDLDDTGIAGSTTRHVFPFPLARWIANNAAGEADFDWRAYKDHAPLDHLLRAILRPSETDAFYSGDYDGREWVELANSAGNASGLGWVVKEAHAARLGNPAIDDLWEMAAPPIAWRLRRSRWSTTRNRLDCAPIVMRNSMRRPPPDPARHIAEPLPGIERLDLRRARAVIEVARAALSARCREVIAVTYPNPDEVYWCDLGEGVALAIIGVAPERRLCLEVNTAYLLLSNGVPIGYGGVTPLYRQANTGINIFDAFRGGEAAFLWVEMLRAFATIYGVRRFIINGYQFGEGNSEAIASGAYWFYYRLGFRPNEPRLRRLAEREAARLKKPDAKKSARATLMDLAKGDLVLDLPGFDPRDEFPESMLAAASAQATRVLSAPSGATRKQSERAIAKSVAERLGAGAIASWPAAERRAFSDLAPIVAIADNIADWSKDERRAVVDMMRAKGRPQECSFALVAAKNERLFRALTKALLKEKR